MSLPRAASHRTARPNAVRALVLLALATLLGVALPSLLAPAGTASAASYRFWGYYQLTGSTWAFATEGSGRDHSQGRCRRGLALRRRRRAGPRASRGPPRPSGHLRRQPRRPGTSGSGSWWTRPAADAGRAPHRPRRSRQCAIVATRASGAEVLRPSRRSGADKGLTCAING